MGKSTINGNSFLYVYQRVMYVMLNPISSTINRHKKRRDSARSTWKIPISFMVELPFNHIKTWLGSFHSPLSFRSVENAEKCHELWWFEPTTPPVLGFSHELMTPEVNGKSLFLVDKTASHSNYTPIPSHEILVGSWLSYGLSTRLLFSSIIWAADHICYITQLTGCSYLVLQSRNVFAYLVLGVFLPRFTS